MADNAQKTPIARTLNRFAENKVRGALSLLGQSLPASVISRAGAIVTVKFEVNAAPFTLPPVTVPLIGSEYVRLPIQAGCKGWVMTADAYLGGMSGLGGGAAGLTSRANLSMLVWSPLGNKNWDPSENDNALLLYGPDGVIIRDAAKKTTMTLTVNGVTFDLQAGDSVTINGNLIVSGNLQISGSIQNLAGGTYAGDIKTAGNIIGGFGTGDQVGLKTHVHTSATAGNPTSAPTAGS